MSCLRPTRRARRDRRRHGDEMTTIPDYLILMAVGPTRASDHEAELPGAGTHKPRPATLSIRGRLGRRPTHWPAADARARATNETLTPPLLDQPYRASC